jgi:hypothetical protein
MSAFRKFPVRERSYAELRAEAYNVFNTVTHNAAAADLANLNFGQNVERDGGAVHAVERQSSFLRPSQFAAAIWNHPKSSATGFP